jgi:predicted transcriptional regulator
VQDPKPSKLELYIEILKALQQHKASKLVDIQERTNVDDEFLERAIAFLQKQNLVEKTNLKNTTVYKNTPRGERVTNYFVAQSQGAPKQEFEFVLPAEATVESTTLPVKN